MLLSLLVSVAVEWLGMVCWWPAAGVEHSQAMLRAELAYLDPDVRHSWIGVAPTQFATGWAERARYVLYDWTGLERLAQSAARAHDPRLVGVRDRLRHGYRHVAPFVHAAVTVAQVFTVRLAVLVLAMPAFGLLSVVGLVDGLVRRDLRRWGGGRESSYLYHLAKGSVWRFVLIAWIGYLALPVSVHPAFILLPFAVLYAISISVTASTFKKYL